MVNIGGGVNLSGVGGGGFTPGGAAGGDLSGTYPNPAVAHVGFGVVQTSLGTATGPVSINNQKITNVLNPTAAQDAATKAYVDAIAQGLNVKEIVRMWSAAALPANTYNNGASGVGATITANANGILFVDGTAAQAGDRVGIKNETAGNAGHNGIYVVTDPGSVGTPFILTRATDMDTAAELPGAFALAEIGTVNASTGWVATVDPDAAGIIIGTTDPAFVQFTGAGDITVTAPIVKTGNNLSAPTAEVTTNKDQPSGYAGLDASSLVIKAIQKVHETGGPTDLTVGAIADGQFVQRSGTSLIGVASPAAYDAFRQGDAQLGTQAALTGALPNQLNMYDNVTATGTVTPVSATANTPMSIKHSLTFTINAGQVVSNDGGGESGASAGAAGTSGNAGGGGNNNASASILSTQAAVNAPSGKAGGSAVNGDAPSLPATLTSNPFQGGVGGGGGGGGAASFNGGQGGAGGSQIASTRNTTQASLNVWQPWVAFTIAAGSGTNWRPSSGGAGGGGGGGGNPNPTGGVGGAGTAGATGGGLLSVTGATLTIGAGGRLSANGLNASAAGNGTNGTTGGSGGGGGGGGGGAAGAFELIEKSISGTTQCNGGLGGAGGLKGPTPSGGGHGADGATGGSGASSVFVSILV